MSETPICDFVREYANRSPVRFHMPGHKGKPVLGCEALDLTEIEGADSLFEAQGIIARSEAIASERFGCPTYYSTEGSSLCVRAMLYLACTARTGKTVLAARSVHKSFLYGAALLDLDVRFLPETGEYLGACVRANEVEKALSKAEEKPCCLYLTFPDYLGAGCDLPAIAEVCQKYGVLLVVDSAHGAYLRFTDPSRFAIDLGADLACTSAHKTLPVLTGGAYLHVGARLEKELSARNVKEAMALFASTSPSYLILQSLDAANARLSDLSSRLPAYLDRVEQTGRRLSLHGYSLFTPERLPCGIECDPMKIVLAPKSFGYTGRELAQILARANVFAEFSDPDYLVLMPSCENGDDDLKILEDLLLSLPRRAPIADRPPRLPAVRRVMSVRQALLSPGRTLPLESCAGQILRDPSVFCPPAVAILTCGEIVTEEALAAFRYYGVEELSVVRA